jgi:hypothetical protein
VNAGCFLLQRPNLLFCRAFLTFALLNYDHSAIFKDIDAYRGEFNLTRTQLLMMLYLRGSLWLTNNDGKMIVVILHM